MEVLVEKVQKKCLKNLAVLLIDMQKDLITSKAKEELIPNQIQIISLCEKNNIPIAVFELANYGGTDERLNKEIDKIPEDLVERFRKKNNNAFSATGFYEWLSGHRVKTLLLMGINACACVYETANSSLENGYQVITSDKLIAGYCSSDCKSKRAWYLNNNIIIDHVSLLEKLKN